jgi:hypothetical protein
MITRDYSTVYNLAKFATLRGYLNIDDFVSISKKRDSIKQEIEEEEREEDFI